MLDHTTNTSILRGLPMSRQQPSSRLAHLFTIRRLLVGLCISVALARALFFVITSASDPTCIFLPDSPSYLNAARALVTIGKFAVSPDQPDVPQIIRTPGYPLFLAAVLRFVGERYHFIIFLQIGLSVLTLWLTFQIARRLWRAATIALSAAGALALDLASGLSSQEILTETIFTCVLTAAVLIGLQIMAAARPQLHLLALLSVGVAFAALVRPIAYYLIWGLLAFYIAFWRIRSGCSWRMIARAGLALLLPCGLMLGGWQYYNYLRIGSPIFSGIAARNLLFYRGADILAQRDSVSFETAQQQLLAQFDPVRPAGLPRHDLAHVHRQWQQVGLRLVRQHPYLALKSQSRGAMQMLLGPGRESLAHHLRGVTARWPVSARLQTLLLFSAVLVLGCCYVSGALALWTLWRPQAPPDWWAHGLLWLVILYLVGLSAGPEAYSRFRVPVMPLLAVYAGAGGYQICWRCKVWWTKLSRCMWLGRANRANVSSSAHLSGSANTRYSNNEVSGAAILPMRNSP